MAILLKTVSVRVSSIQIMQVRVENKGKVFGKVDTTETYQQAGCPPSRALPGSDGCTKPAWEELMDVDACLETEGFRLVHEWRQLKMAINLERLQRQRANTKTEASLATSREASARALEKAREADRRREVAEKRW